MKAIKKPSYMLKNAGRVHPVWAQLLLFCGVFFLAAFAEGLVLLILYSVFPETQGKLSVADLYSTVGSVGVMFLFCKLLEQRTNASLLLRLSKKTGFFSEYLTGLICGALMLSLTVLFCALSGALTVTLTPLKIGAGTILLFFGGYMVQGFSEELMCRGYFLSALMPTVSLRTAVLLSSLFFGALHLFNTGITALALVNITLFAVFASLFALRRGSLWAVAGIHTAWNFTQGVLFGSAVSGNRFGPSVFSAVFNADMTLINGGSFGLEGGLAVTAVFCLGILYTLFFMEQKN